MKLHVEKFTHEISAKHSHLLFEVQLAFIMKDAGGRSTPPSGAFIEWFGWDYITKTEETHILS